MRHISPNLQNELRNYQQPEILFQQLAAHLRVFFSASGNKVSFHRASLKPETVDRLVFLAKNLNKK